jgi:hypothetical protein
VWIYQKYYFTVGNEYMRYYVMEPLGNVFLPATKKREGVEVVLTSNINRFNDIDYDMSCGLISERLKLVLEMFLLQYHFEPVVYLDMSSKENINFFRFNPPEYEGCITTFRNDGIVSRIIFTDADVPLMFTVRSPKGVRSIIMKIAVAESILRRRILGVEFTKVTDD